MRIILIALLRYLGTHCTQRYTMSYYSMFMAMPCVYDKFEHSTHTHVCVIYIVR